MSFWDIWLTNVFRKLVKEMFHFAYDNYVTHAFPMDELKPISCSGEESFKGMSVTMVDTLDTLAIMGNSTEFSKQVDWVCANLHFNKDENVSVFETNIRVLGGLLSAHLLACDVSLALHNSYDGCLLILAEDLGNRLMRAFDVPSGIPFGTVNLRYGVPEGETTITSVAGAGSFSIEFGVLSRLTGNSSYEDAAYKALNAIYSKRTVIGLLGNHIDISTGEWTHGDAGIGGNVDSLYEYLLKSAILFGDQRYLDMFTPLYDSVLTHMKKNDWYIEVNMYGGQVTWPFFSTLHGFWPGMQVLYGKQNSILVFHASIYFFFHRRLELCKEDYEEVHVRMEHERTHS